MSSRRASPEDAIHIFTLTIAYLYDAKFDVDAVNNAMRAREMSSNLFYIWRQEQHDKHGGGVPLVAKCRYNEVQQTWKVELFSGETLTLLDKGNIWEIVSDAEMHLVANVAKKALRNRDRRRKRA